MSNAIFTTLMRIKTAEVVDPAIFWQKKICRLISESLSYMRGNDLCAQYQIFYVCVSASLVGTVEGKKDNVELCWSIKFHKNEKELIELSIWFVC